MENQTKNTLRLRFLGAIGTVTGSCTLLEYYCCDNNQKQYFLIDAGSFQNENNNHTDERNKVLQHFAKDIQMVFITHAHLDHIGILPEIIKYGFRGKVCCTQATHELIETMLTYGEGNENNEKLLEKISFFEIDGRHGDKHNNGFGKTYIPITHDFRYGYLRSSHVLGSCTIYFQWTEKNYPDDCPAEEKEWKYMYFSGDIGPVTDKVMANILFKGHQTPYWDKSDKCIVMESTYGGTVRPKDDLFQRKINKLEEIINATNSRDGVIIIPAFALDRAQQILADLFYISKNKETTTPLSADNDENWENILITICGNTMLKNIVKAKYVKAFEGNVDLQKIIKKGINSVIKGSGYTLESKFSDLSDEIKKQIANVFEKNNVQKPSLDRQNSIQKQLNFSIDSPLIEKINEIYVRHLTDEAFSDKYKKRKFKYLSDYFSQEFNISDDEFNEQKTEIKKLLYRFLKNSVKNPKIIVTASGMCDEGRVLNLLGKYLPDENATLILTGYQAVNTNGFLLKNLLNNKYDENNDKERIPLKLRNNDLRLADIKCTIEDMSDYYSGHADQEQLLDYLNPDERNTGNIAVLLNHGTDNAREILKTKIEERNNKIKVVLPEFNKWFNVVTSEYEPEDIEFKKETITQFYFVQVGDIHIYYPIGYDSEKIQSIIDHINEL